VIVTKLEPEDMERFNLSPAAKDKCRFKRSPLIGQKEYPGEDSYVVFSFDTIDTAAAATHAISSIFTGQSQLYKHDGQYFLWFLNESEDDRTTADLEAIMLEFGRKHVSSVLSRQYLEEHAELVVDDAVRKLEHYIV